MSARKNATIARLVAGMIPLFSLLAASCEFEKSDKMEARELFERISALDADAPEPSRRARIDALAALSLRSPELAHARDVCLTAHRGLLLAETEQETARRALDELSEKHPKGGIPAPETERVAAAITRSNRALSEAQLALPECEAQSRQLALRAR